MKKMYSEELANVVKQTLDDSESECLFNEDKGIFHFNMKIMSIIRTLEMYINVGPDKINVCGVCPIGVDMKSTRMMRDMEIFLGCINRFLSKGEFKLDYNSGDISYEIHMKCNNYTPSTLEISAAIYLISMMYTKYAHGIVGIICAKSDPEKLIDMCERGNYNTEVTEEEPINGSLNTDNEMEKIVHALFEQGYDL